ncbi:MAG: PAS domain-containing protein, partial [Verrucomicrobiales bacterium]|nr:PAS domain-containing protein [Verrucomicrobiales bacterium]
MRWTEQVTQKPSGRGTWWVLLLAAWGLFMAAGRDAEGAEGVESKSWSVDELVTGARSAEVGGELVRLRGWVSFAKRGWPGFFLQGEGRGIYCELAQLSPMPAVGEELEVEGFVAVGARPFLRVTVLRRLGVRTLGEAPEVEVRRLLSGEACWEWVRVSGVITEAARGAEATELQLSVGGDLVQVRLGDRPAVRDVPPRWTRVTVSGVASEEVNVEGQRVRVMIWAESSRVRVLEGAEAVLRGMPVVDLGTWSDRAGEGEPGALGGLLRTAGVVTMVIPPAIAIEEAGGAMVVNGDDGGFFGALELGHRVEVVGWWMKSGARQELQHAQILRLLGTGEMLPRKRVDGGELLEVKNHGRRVMIEGELLHRSAARAGDVLVCGAEGKTFEAALQFFLDPAELETIRQGARLELTGVLRLESEPRVSGLAPRLTVSRRADLRVARAAPWPAQWTARVVGAMSLALAFGLVGLGMAYRRLKETHRKLAGTEWELRQLNHDLEDRIAERTGELARSNEQLAEENARRRTALEALEDRERRLVEAQVIARLGSFEWDGAEDRVRWSPELYVICGVAPESFVPSLASWLGCVHVEDRRRVETSLRGAVESGRDVSHEYRIVRPSGEVRWVHTLGRIVAANGGGTCGLEGTCQDITDRKLSELALRTSEARLVESERRFRSLVEGAGVVVWEYDPATEAFTYVSPQAARFGYPLSDWLKPHFWEGVVHAEDRREAMDYCERMVRGGFDHRMQYRLITAGGGIVWIDDTVSVDRRPDGSVLLRGVLSDVTELRQAEESRLKLEIRLRQAQKMEAIGTLAGGIAHDFNNLLGIIMGTAELARSGPSVSPEWKAGMEDILVAGRRGRDLVQRMLAFSRREETPRQSLSLVDLVADAMRLLRAAIPANIQLDFRTEGDVPSILGDGTQIHQVLMNLTANAAQAIGPRAGRV